MYLSGTKPGHLQPLGMNKLWPISHYQYPFCNQISTIHGHYFTSIWPFLTYKALVPLFSHGHQTPLDQAPLVNPFLHQVPPNAWLGIPLSNCHCRLWGFHKTHIQPGQYLLSQSIMNSPRHKMVVEWVNHVTNSLKMIFILRLRQIGVLQSLHDVLNMLQEIILSKPKRCTFELIYQQEDHHSH